MSSKNPKMSESAMFDTQFLFPVTEEITCNKRSTKVSHNTLGVTQFTRECHTIHKTSHNTLGVA